MFNLFQTDRMCFEYIANIFAKSNAEKRIFFTTKYYNLTFYLNILKRSAKS